MKKPCACPPVSSLKLSGSDCRIVHDDGGDVRVNGVPLVDRGLVNVINGLENVMLIYVGVVTLLRFLIL